MSEPTRNAPSSGPACARNGALYAGIDLGTSAVKVLVVDGGGSVVGRGEAGYPVDRPRPGWAEQDPETWWAAAGDACRAAITGLDPRRVAGIGVTGQMHGTVLLGADDRPVRPAIIWMDQRSTAQVAEITGGVGRDRLIALAGSPLATGFQAATVAWCRRHEPELWAKVRRVALPKDALRHRMTGEWLTDASDASGTLLLDVRERDWSSLLLAAAGIDRAYLPPVGPSTASAGTLRSDAASHLGLPAGTPVVVGAGDAPAAALGAGVIGPETLFLTISTGSQVLVPAPSPGIDAAGRLHTFCAAPGPDEAVGWYVMGASLAAGLALHWLRDRVFSLEGPEALDRMTAWAAEVPAGANGLLFVPYLLGERTPHMDPDARGTLLGLTAAHERGDLVRAVMEGVIFATRDAALALAETGAAPERIVVAGGGSRSPLWLQMIADVHGRPVTPLATVDQSAVGAALLAAAGTGERRLADLARDWPVLGTTVFPDEARHRRYADLFPIYRATYGKHQDDFATLGRVHRDGTGGQTTG
ncbi:MAG: xylulokinase [Chloroflexia bacterium]|nr:xylulokinase [Chloroflexia bacterium]